MSFANFSLPWVLGGLAVLAAGLAVLQILRIRYREVRVVSTMLWRQAVEEAPVRKFWERFRHPWAYLLILGICSLLWLALAEPRRRHDAEGRFHVLVLDGSAAMAAGQRYDAAVAALKERLRDLPAERRQVLWSGAEVRTLLNPGEDALLLDPRLEELAPEAAPARVEELIADLGRSRFMEAKTEVLVFGAAPVRPAVLASLPPTLVVRRAQAPEPLERNHGITALGVADARSGAWDRVDVVVQVEGVGDHVGGADEARRLLQQLSVELDGRPLPAAKLRLEPVPSSESGDEVPDGATWLLRDLPAEGGLLTVHLAGADDLSLDDAAQIRLPNRPYVKVRLAASLDPVLRAVLAADPAVRLTDVDPDVVIRRQGEGAGRTGGRNLPSLEFVRAEVQPQAFLLTYPQSLEAGTRLSEAVAALGLQQIDAMSLADAAQRPIEVSMQGGSRWELSLWEELLSEEYNFTRSRSFPLFLARAVRWLAGVPAAYPYAAAGRPLISDGVVGAGAFLEAPSILEPHGRRIDPLGVPFVPERAGELSLVSDAQSAGAQTQSSTRAAGTQSLAVSLLDPFTTAGAGSGDDPLEPARRNGGGGVSGAHWVTALLTLALLLLAVEWYGYRKERMP